jgi:hypothetical protein
MQALMPWLQELQVQLGFHAMVHLDTLLQVLLLMPLMPT